MYQQMIAAETSEQLDQREFRSASGYQSVGHRSTECTALIAGNGLSSLFRSTNRYEAEEFAEWKHPLQSVAAYQVAIERWSRSASANRDEIEVALAGMDTSIARLRELLAKQCNH